MFCRGKYYALSALLILKYFHISRGKIFMSIKSDERKRIIIDSDLIYLS